MWLSGHLGAVASTAIARLQNALNALGQQQQDPKLLLRVDGVMGPATAAATNRALGVYVVQSGVRIPSTWQRATTSMIAASANDMAAYIERAAGPDQAAPPSAPPPQSGGYPMPYYQQPQPGYYPQQPPSPYGYGGPTRAPGGLPIDHASLDVKAFIPAQYDHIQLDPAMGMAILAAGLGVVLLVSHHKNRHQRP